METSRSAPAGAGGDRARAERIELRFRRIVEGPARGMPLPGSGRTAERFEMLADWAGEDLAVGRLVEAHADALAILAEAGRTAHPAAAYGVWAARSRGADLIATPHGQGWHISGAKAFCSGAQIVSRALLTASAPDGYRLFDVDLSQQSITFDFDSWSAVGMAEPRSPTAFFDQVEVDDEDAVGAPSFYLDREGFWIGAIGVAACWFGGARALVGELIAGLAPSASDAVLAEAGRAVSLIRAQKAVIERAAAEVDLGSRARGELAHMHALAARQAVHDACVEVLGLVAGAGGARPLVHEPAQARRAADLYVYLAQHHGGRDAAELGRLAIGEDPWA